MSYSNQRTTIFFLLSFLPHAYQAVTAKFSDSEVHLELEQAKRLDIFLNGTFIQEEALFVTYQASVNAPVVTNGSNEVIYPIPDIIIPANSSASLSIDIKSKKAGNVLLGINSSSPDFYSDGRVFCNVHVVNSHLLDVIQMIIGWIYFAAWAASFYPQILLNFRRKSVVGCSFDYIAFNFIGHSAYCVFNVALYWVEPIRQEYFDRNPRGVIQVQINDVVFSIHSVILVLLMIIQTRIYEREGQKLSRACYLLCSVMILFILICLILTLLMIITWLNYVTYFSYVKLFVTLIKYTPQVFLNYRRKSTIGWAIASVFFDFSGGILSVFQMFIVSYNSDDWAGIFGDPTKFGLGIFTMFFDVIFFIQHYCLYRGDDSTKHLTIAIDADDEAMDSLINKNSSISVFASETTRLLQ